MEENNTEITRKKYISKIREKIRNNPKYIHPCNKEYQEDIKRLEFSSGNEYQRFLIENRILKNPSDIAKDHRNKLAIQKGYKDDSERRKSDGERHAKELGYVDHSQYYKDYRHKTGRNLPLEFNENCPQNFGSRTEKIIEKFLLTIFEYVKGTGYHDGEIDFFCKTPKKEFIDKYPQFKLEKDKEYRIQHRSKCLQFNGMSSSLMWLFKIDHDKKNDYFLLSAWRDRESLEPMHLWLIHRNENIRRRKLWEFIGLGITNKSQNLIEFRKYEIDELDILKELRDKLIENGDI